MKQKERFDEKTKQEHQRSLKMYLYMMAGALWYGSNMSRAFRML